MNEAIENCKNIRVLQEVRTELDNYDEENLRQIRESFKRDMESQKVYRMVMSSRGPVKFQITEASRKVCVSSLLK